MLLDLVEVARSVSVRSSISARAFASIGRPRRASRSSSSNSMESDEKLLTKLSGFLISWAIPAVSWPSEASFWVCTKRSCAVCRSSSDCASSRVRASTLSNKRTFSIAIAAWSAKVVTSSICLSVNGRTSVRVNVSTPIRNALAQHRHAKHCAEAAELSGASGPSVFGITLYVRDMNNLPLKQGTPGPRIAPDLDRNISWRIP